MHAIIKESLWNQFGASIDMLENAINLCPPQLWNNEKKFWYNAYHCLFFLDYYLTRKPSEFKPPKPFSFSEFENRMPEKVYTKNELIAYLKSNRKKCFDLITDATETLLEYRWINQSKTMNYSMFEILIYNLRHVQHHAAQLNLILRQEIDDAPSWVSRTSNLNTN